METARKIRHVCLVEGKFISEIARRFHLSRKTVHKYLKGASPASFYVLLSFDPGETYQFDWSHEMVELSGMPQKIKVAHFHVTKHTSEDRARLLYRGAINYPASYLDVTTLRGLLIGDR